MKRVILLVVLAGCNDPRAVHDLDPDLNRMLDQPRAEAYGTNDALPGGAVMRAPPRGTVPYARAVERPALTRELLTAGRDRFEAICATCHGVAGGGESVVASKMEHRRPPSFVEPRLLALSDDDIFAVATDGYGFMPGFAAELEPRERWAIVAYVRALQKSRHARVADLPPEVRARLAKESP